MEYKVLGDFINLVDLSRPLLVTCVGAALMEQNALDNALMAGTKRTFKYTEIRNVVVRMHEILEPTSFATNGCRVILLEEMLYLATTNSHVNHTNADRVWQLLDHRSTKVVGRS